MVSSMEKLVIRKNYEIVSIIFGIFYAIVSSTIAYFQQLTSSYKAFDHEGANCMENIDVGTNAIFGND